MLKIHKMMIQILRKKKKIKLVLLIVLMIKLELIKKIKKNII